MNGLNAPRILAPSRAGTIIGLLIGIGIIVAAILLDRVDPPHQAPPVHHTWIPPLGPNERVLAAKLEQPEERP